MTARCHGWNYLSDLGIAVLSLDIGHRMTIDLPRYLIIHSGRQMFTS